MAGGSGGMTPHPMTHTATGGGSVPLVNLCSTLFRGCHRGFFCAAPFRFDKSTGGWQTVFTVKPEE